MRLITETRLTPSAFSSSLPARLLVRRCLTSRIPHLVAQGAPFMWVCGAAGCCCTTPPSATTLPHALEGLCMPWPSTRAASRLTGESGAETCASLPRDRRASSAHVRHRSRHSIRHQPMSYSALIAVTSAGGCLYSTEVSTSGSALQVPLSSAARHLSLTLAECSGFRG